MARTGKSLAELASVMTVYPQVLVNVRDVDHHGLDSDEQIAEAVRDANAKLGDTGRVLLRPPAPSRSCASWSRPRITSAAERIADRTRGNRARAASR